MFGNFAAFTYIRSGLSLNPAVTDGDVATYIGAFGLAAVVGSVAIGVLVDRHLLALRVVAPIMIACGSAAIAFLSGHQWLVVTAIMIWGAAFGGWLIIVSEWVARMAPAQMESGGGLVVAGYQLAITLGAGIGGEIVDHTSVGATFGLASVIALAGGALFATSASASASAGAPQVVASTSIQNT